MSQCAGENCTCNGGLAALARRVQEEKHREEINKKYLPKPKRKR